MIEVSGESDLALLLGELARSESVRVIPVMDEVELGGARGVASEGLCAFGFVKVEDQTSIEAR